MDENSLITVGMSRQCRWRDVLFRRLSCGSQSWQVTRWRLYTIGESVDSDAVGADGAAAPASPVDPADG